MPDQSSFSHTDDSTEQLSNDTALGSEPLVSNADGLMAGGVSAEPPILLPQRETSTPSYTPPTRPNMQSNAEITASVALEYEEPENENEQDIAGAAITVAMTGKSLRPGMPAVIDGYLSHVEFSPMDENSPFGVFYIKLEDQILELTNGMVFEDYAGNIYTISSSENSFSITIDSSSSSWKPVDLSQLNLWYHGAEYDDKDPQLNYVILADSGKGETKNIDSQLYITIDAVANAPVYETGTAGGAVIGPEDGSNLSVSETDNGNGVITQTISGASQAETGSTMFSLGTVTFKDYNDVPRVDPEGTGDGVEYHYILIAAEDVSLDWDIDLAKLSEMSGGMFTLPDSGELETVWLDANNAKVEAGTPGAKEYIKLPISNEYLAAHGGTIDLNLPIKLPEGMEAGEYIFDAKAVAEENPVNSWVDWEEYTDNNFAVTDIEAVRVLVQDVEAKITISTGWAYESGAAAGSADNPDADPAGAGMAAGESTQTFQGLPVSAVPIKLTFEMGEDESVGQWITLSYDAGLGDVYFNGSKVNSTIGGKAFVTLPSSGIVDGELTAWFVPDPASDADADFDLHYDFTVTKGTGEDAKTFNAVGDMPVVIDAVADPAAAAVAPSGEPPESDGFTLAYTLPLSQDSAETHYIVISNPDGQLSLGDLGGLASHLSPVTLAELQAFEHPDPAIGRHFDHIGPNDIILRIDDPAALDALDGSADGSIALRLPFTVNDRAAAGESLAVTVSTVVVEGGGNNPDNWDQTSDKEYDFANNIAVTAETATVHLAQGSLELAVTGGVHEGDLPDQHIGGSVQEYGVPIQMTLGDPFEAVREISFNLSTADGSPVDGAIAFGIGGDYTLVPEGGSLRFSAEAGTDAALYTGVDILDAAGSVIKSYVISPAATLEDLAGSGEASGLRFIPSGDNDADVHAGISSLTVTDTRSGDLVTVDTESVAPVTIIRDAVADLAEASSSITPESGHEAVVAGSTVTVDIAATFTDHGDSSEAQYLFVSKAYLSSLTIPASLSGVLTVLDDDAANAVCGKIDGQGGIPGATADAYFVIRVDPAHLQQTGGQLDLPLGATLRTDIVQDGNAQIDIKAVTVEHDGFLTPTGTDLGGGNVESDASNNVAVSDAPAHIAWATLENVFTFTVDGPAHEDDLPDQHSTLTPQSEGGAAIRITPQDDSEVFDTLTVSYAGEDGSPVSGSLVLSAGGASLTIPSGTTLIFTYDADDPARCIKVSYTDGEGEHSLAVPGLTLAELTSGGLRYVPASGSDSDTDVEVTFSGTTRETESGETGVYAQQTVQIVMDAVADKPAGETSAYDYGTDADGRPLAALPENSPVSFAVEAVFGDYADGSEAHYLFVNTKYLADGSLQLLDGGQPFTGGTQLAGDALDTLLAQIAGDPGLIPGPDDAYVVWKLDPEYLAGHGGSLSLTVTGTLKDAAALAPIGPEKTPLDLEVKAVAVEHEGYLTSEQGTASGNDDEADATNNVAVTEVGTQIQWDALAGQFDLTAENAHEGDQPGQHAGDLAVAGGATLTITPQDATEVLTSMTLSYDAGHGDLVLSVDAQPPLVLAPGAEISFVFDPVSPTRIVSLTCGDTTLTVPGLTLEELTSGGLRYVPHAGDDDDADVTVSIEAATLETNTGVTGTAGLTGVIVVDAVADRPADAASALIVTSGKGDTVIVNEAKAIDSFDVSLKATFADYADGSEAHYFFISDQYLASLEGLPQGISRVDAAQAADIIADAGLEGGYFVLRVDSAYLQSHAGEVDVTLTAHLDGDKLPPEDQALHVDIQAGAIEHQGVNTPVDGTGLGDGHGQDSDATNNVSLVDMGLDLHYARLDNGFEVSVSTAHEGDAPNQHVGDTLPEGGATVDFAPADASEVFDTLAVSYDGGEGSLYLDLPTLEAGNIRLELPSGAQLSFTYRNEGAGATTCTGVSVTTPEGTTVYTLSSQLELRDLMGGGRLHYIPAADSQSDADVVITFSGTSRETATGESGDFSHDVTVTVDAVADRPDATGGASNVEAGRTALEPGTSFTVSVNADFGGDLSDGSEKHYVFISREHLSGLVIPAALGGAVSLLAGDAAAAVCAQVDGANGIPGANADDYYVLAVDDAWLQAHDGKIDLQLEGTLKDAAALAEAGGAEGAPLTLEMKAVAVEHQGFQTPTGEDLGGGHGQDGDASNNVSVEDASADFTWAVVDGGISAEAAPAFEGSQPEQHLGDFTAQGGAAVTLSPQDASEVFTDLTLTYDDSHGSLTLASPDGTSVTLGNGARLVFSYDADDPTRCLSVQVWQAGGTAPVATLSFADAAGAGLDLAALTSSHLKYVPAAGDDSDADVGISFSGTLLETASGAQAPVSGSLNVVVDAVADMAQDASGSAVVITEGGERPGALPGETVTVRLDATFDDYADGTEAHYIFVAREHLPVLSGIPSGVEEVTDPATLADIFNAIAKADGTGIQSGPGASADYHVLKVSSDYLLANDGRFSMSMTVTAGEKGVYPVDAAAVSVEHDGYLTNTGDADGSGANRDATAENNVAVADMGFAIVVREFEPGEVTAVLGSEWAYENDRSEGDEAYHEAGSPEDRDHGVTINFSGQGEGNVITSATFEYAMPSNGSAVPHTIQSLNADGTVNTDVTVHVDTTSKPGTVIVTVTSNDPYGSVGDLHFIPGDNYDNDDVDITVTNVEVADPFLHQSTVDDPAWGNGVAPDGAALHVKVDAVAQAPGLDNFVVDHDSGNPVEAGGVIHITGKVSYEDTFDGSERHFLLLELQDGYYPDGVTLTFNGETVTIPVEHYVSGNPPTEANYTLQQLITADDGQPHLFIKLPVDGALAELMDGRQLERMDDISLDVTYQTREWASEGASLHFAAIASEDVESVREYDAGWNITNDELPFDKQLEQYVPGLTVTDNNTAITIAAQGAYVYWDEVNSNALNFKGYVFENDRPADHQRDPAYFLDREDPAPDVEYAYPVAPELTPEDAATGRDFGTGMELVIPEHTRQISITATEGNLGSGDFYFLPETVWEAYMAKSPAPDADTALSAYRVNPNGDPATAQGSGEYMLVFIPSQETYDEAHGETGPTHKDHDFRFSYELRADQYGPNGEWRGEKTYTGTDMVIRVDAVANQASIEYAGTDGTREFSLWNGTGTTSTFDLTVSFHDLDGTEDHFILVEMVPNFAFRCGSYQYIPGQPGISPNDNEAIYTHVMTDAEGNQQFIRYYKIPVDMADIDPVTGQVTVEVEFLRQPGMPGVADYPSSHELTYGALTEDKTCSRWDSNDPTAENFINRKGADGEYSYENNTSVIIRNGMEHGAADGDKNPGWWQPGPDGSGGGGGHIHWENGPGYGWSQGWIPGGGGDIGGYWKEDGPVGGGPGWWKPGGGITEGGGTIEDWIPGGGGKWGELGGGGGGGGHIDVGGGGGMSPDGSDSPWIASRGQGLAIEWVFENSTPLGHIEDGQYAGGVVPATVYFTGENPDAEYVYITVPIVYTDIIVQSGTLLPWKISDLPDYYGKATFSSWIDSEVNGTDSITYKIHAPGGQLAGGGPLFMLVLPDSMGEDFQLDVRWEDANGHTLSSGPVDVLVDAVAQWANFTFAEHEDGVYGVTGDDPTSLLRVDVDVAYLDQDGSESNYLLVEKIPGVLPLHADGNGGYEALREVYLNGVTYYLIEPSAQEQADGTVPLYISVNEELLSPMYVRDDILHTDGHLYTGVRLTVGTMTVEGQIGRPAIDGEPANWEYTLDNNTSLNLREDYLSIFVSKVNAEGGDNAVMVKETGTPEEHIFWLDPSDPASGLDLTMDGNDVLTELIFTGAAGSGSFWYVDEAGVEHVLPTGVDMKEAYLAGRIFHKQDPYQDADATLTWTATVKDGITDSSTAEVGGTLTVAVDAVARAEEIHCGFPALDREAGTLTQTLSFDDHLSNEQHYAVIAPDLYRVVGKRAQVRDADGQWHTVDVETIFDPQGNPYYAVSVDGWLDASGSVTVRFELHELNIAGIEKFPVISGGVSVEPNTGYDAGDREMDLTDNWAINTRVDKVSEGVVSTSDLAFAIDAVTEDDAAGAAIVLTGTMGDNDTLVSATLTFSPRPGTAAFAGEPGEQIATLVYAGQCFAVTLDAAGKASAGVDFGAGFDPAADFRIVWGVAHMQDGQLVVTEWNHAAGGTLDLETGFTLQNQLSGQTGTATGADPDGVALVARADAATDVAGAMSAVNGQPAGPSTPVGAAADSVTVTISGQFADVDGSETHYLLLEVPEGWQVSAPQGGTYETVEGTRYYRVSVSATEASPSVDVTLVSPDGLNGSVTLKTGAQSVEGNGDSAFTQGDGVTLEMSDVSAAGLDVDLEPVQEDGLLSLADMGLAQLVGNDGNDTLLSVTFTDLKGGSIVDAQGDPVAAGPDGLPLTASQLASGSSFYRPAPDHAGGLDAEGRPLPLELTYDALLGETDTGATATLSGRTVSVTVIPVADAPSNVAGVSNTPSLDDVQTGHKAAASVTLEAAFGDVDGSEEHFFILSGPQGVAVVAGAGYAVSLLTAEDAAALGLSDSFASGPLYKVTLEGGTTASVSLDVALEVTTTIYNGGELRVVGGSAELRQDGTYSYACSEESRLTLPPAIGHEIGNNAPVAEEGAATLDSLRAVSVQGSVATDIDADGDAVTPGGLRFGDTQGTRGTVDGKACWSVQGEYGTLHLFDDGAYRYDLDPAHQGDAGEEVFTYTMQDGYGGEGQSAITITLTNDNTAPASSAFTAQLDSVRQTAVGSGLVFEDAEGDAVSVAGVNGDTTLTNLGTADAPRWGFRVAGDYGTLEVWEADGQWRYSYTLDAAHKGETEDEHFTLTLRDAYGMESLGTLDVDLYNVNSDPVAQAGVAGMDTLRDADGEVSGMVAVSDADGDSVTLEAATGYNGAAGAWGEDDRGQAALVVAGQHGTLYLYQSGGDSLQYRYVLTDAAAGGLDAVETFTYTVDDGYLGTATNTITIELSNANAAPEITGRLDAELDTLRDADRTTQGSLAFSDPDLNVDQGRHDLVTLTGAAFGAAAGVSDGQGGFTVNGAYGVFHIDATGAYTYTLSPDAAGTLGTEDFTITVTDEFGATHSETVSIDLLVHNQDPTAGSGSVDLNTWRGGGRAAGQVALADADGDAVTVDSVSGLEEGVWGVDPEGDPAFVVRGQYGLLYVHADGAYLYALDEGAQGASGTDEFSFTVQDGFGGSASGSITIHLDDANAAPVLSGDITASIGGDIGQYEDEIVRESGRLTWSDADGDAIGFVSVGGETLPASGTLEVEGRYGTLVLTTDGGNGASWSYTLNPGVDAQGITDVESFDIVVRDIYGGESSQSLSIDLAPLSHAPECDDVNYNWPRTPSGDPVSFLEGDLSFRDADMAYDPDESLSLHVNGTSITEAASVAGQYGSLTIHPDGSFTYTSVHIGEALLEDFTYTVTDAAGNSAEAHLYIRLSDSAPVFPNTGGTEEGIFAVQTEAGLFAGLDLFSADGSAFSGLTDGEQAPAPADDGAAHMPQGMPAAEPLDVALTGVPLPYEADLLHTGS